MEPLVVIAQQRTQYESRGRSDGLGGRYGGSPGSGSFREFNCRGYHSKAAGLDPTPLKNASSSSAAAPIARSPVTPRSVLPSVSSCEVRELVKTCPTSAPIMIRSRAADRSFRFDELAYSELWAGPAYSNSPPPSSVPIPKFSTRGTPTRTVSLELPVIAREEIELHLYAKSAPASPRELKISGRDFFGTADNATEALRRILNLDIPDE